MVRNRIRIYKTILVCSSESKPPAGLYEGLIIYVSSAEQRSPLVALHPNICIAVDPKGGLDTEGQYLTDMAKDKSWQPPHVWRATNEFKCTG